MALTETLHQQKPYIPLELTIYKVISLRVYLTIPGSNWGKYLRFPPWFMVPWRAPRESCFSGYFPLRGVNITSVLIVNPVCFSPLRFLSRLTNLLYLKTLRGKREKGIISPSNNNNPPDSAQPSNLCAMDDPAQSSTKIVQTLANRRQWKTTYKLLYHWPGLPVW